MKMKKAILLCGMLLAITASSAMAGGLGLRWANCEGDGGTANLVFACNTNAGNRSLACSFTLDTDLLNALSDELVLDVATASPTLAAWWELRGTAATACRVVGTAQALSIAAQDGASCPDLFALSGSMNLAAYLVGTNGPNKARILAVNAVPSTSPVNLILADNPAGNATWGVARFTINNSKTAGTPSCAGCSIPACIVFNSCLITTVNHAADRLISGPAAPGSDFAAWQGGGGIELCPGATPTKNATWGTVKSLYR
jgi:hypothetical protein